MSNSNANPNFELVEHDEYSVRFKRNGGEYFLGWESNPNGFRVQFWQWQDGVRGEWRDLHSGDVLIVDDSLYLAIAGAVQIGLEKVELAALDFWELESWLPELIGIAPSVGDEDVEG